MKDVLVIFGGVSTEHEISQRSALNIVSGLREAGLEPHIVGISREGVWLPFTLEDSQITNPDWESLARVALNEGTKWPTLNPMQGFSVKDFLESLAGSEIDVIFPAVHGINCEDGILQGLLELSGIPYVGSGVMASAISMDKLMCKKILSLVNIPQAAYVSCRREHILNNVAFEMSFIERELGFPCFVKPANGGSSVGTAKANNLEELQLALEQAAKFDARVLVEEYIPARELEVAVMGNQTPFAAAVGEVAVQADGAYYDYENKYLNDDGAQVKMPAELTEDEARELRALAIEVYKTLDCRGLARVDFFKHKQNGQFYFNEINNLPGFTAISLFPQAFAYEGIALPELLLRLCHLAEEEKKNKERSSAIY